ncbi:outer membrane beta-barrel protein [Reichenbachiella sp.]|uniref:outer membrane beta-barrel protein n=1 Tax=Reichenbachiella sp. TaxID=2184521 RepID=UPI003BB05E08
MGRANWTFEEQWSQALDEAEVSPPEQVWVAIDGQLANEQAAGYKKEADFYKWIAAACLFLFTIGGAVHWYQGAGAFNNEMVQSSSGSNNGENSDDSRTSLPVAIAEDDEETKSETLSEVSKNESLGSSKTGEVPMNPDIKTVANNSSYQSINELEQKTITQRAGLSEEWIAPTPKSTSLASILVPWKTDKLYGVARTWEVIPDDDFSGPLWAGASFSRGAFDPGFGSSQDDLVFANQESFVADALVSQTPQRNSASYTSGQSVAGGLNLGKRLNKRFVLSSGLHYSAFNTGSATSQVVADANDNNYALTEETDDVNLEAALSEGNLRYAGQEVQLANEYQYLTVPLKAGYILLDKKFNITVNTGLSSNFLIDSELVSSGESQTLSNDFSTSESYNSIYFNFLTSVEFGYVFKQHYQFLLEPNYNQALTNFTSSNHSDNAKPRNVGVTVGFRYNF